MKHFPTLLEWRLKYAEQAARNEHDHNRLRKLVDIFASYKRISGEVDAFYSQPLALWMFIPCNEEGKPMETPDSYFERVRPNRDAFEQHEEAYEAAQKRVLFEGWEVIDSASSGAYVLKRTNGAGLIAVPNTKYEKTIDKFVNVYNKYAFPTQSALTQLNIKP